MPLRVIRSPIKAREALLAATVFASITVDVSDMVQFTPVRAAAGLLLVILQTIQEMDANKDACYRLARRAATILLDLRRRMDGRWDNAPRALIENIQDFEKVLVAIRDYMQELSKLKWMARLLNKHSIEDTLGEYSTMLDEAERRFQTATLIEIHYSVNMLQKQRSGVVMPVPEPAPAPAPSADTSDNYEVPPAYASGESLRSNPTLVQNFTISAANADVGSNGSNEASPLQEINVLMDELKDIEGSGFTRYHQSEVRLKSSIKTSAGFWSDSSNAEVDGKQVVVKRYDGSEPIARWIHDVKRLRNLYHPNLPQMIGLSDENTPTPFVILAKVKLRDPNAFVWNALQSRSIAECAAMMLRMYRDVTSATLYVQRQMSLNESETQDFVSDASYSLDGDGNVIVGLPPPKDKRWVTARNYRLIESLTGTCLKILPGEEKLQSLQGTSDAKKQIELQNKFLHVRSLTRALFPSRSSSNLTLQEAVDELLDEFEDDPASLVRLRELTLRSDPGEDDYVQAWHENVSNCDVKLVAGDIGYIASDTSSDGKVNMMDKTRFSSFVKLGNVSSLFSPLPTRTSSYDGSVNEHGPPNTSLRSEGYDMSAVKETAGTQMQWVNGFIQRQTAWPFILPSEIEGWSVLLQPQYEISMYIRHQVRLEKVTEAWRYLLREAKRLAQLAGPNVQPHEIILITRSVNAQTHIAKHFGQPPFLPGRSPHAHLMHNRPGVFPPPHSQHSGRSFPHQNSHAPSHAMPPFQPLPGQGLQMMYLFTSPRSDFEPFWADDPSMAMIPEEHRRPAPRFVTTRVSWPGAPEASIDYVQLSREDFEERL